MTIASAVRLVLLGAIWGSSFAFTRAVVHQFGPALLIELRLLIAAGFLLLVALILRRSLQLHGNLRHYAIVGVVNSAVPFLLFGYAALELPASLLAIFNSLAPMFGAIVAAAWLRTPITRETTLGLLAGSIGVVVLTRESLASGHLDPAAPRTLLALGAALLAPLCYGIVACYIRRHPARIEPLANAHGSMWAATIALLPLALMAPVPGEPTGSAWVVAGTLGLLCTGAAYLLHFRLIAEVGPVRALTVTFLIPLFGVLWGAIFLDEPIGLAFVLGGVLILLGTGFANGLLRLPGSRRVSLRP